MQNDLLAAISEKLPDFSKSHKLIANFILNHYEKAAYMTALKLGNAVGVSESTVVRFAIEMGFEGYPELQKSLQSHIKNRLTSLQRMEVASGRIPHDNILHTILNQDIDKIRRTLEETSKPAFDEAVEKILSAKKVYILGAMSSGVLATFLNHYLEIILDNVFFVQATNMSGIYHQMVKISSGDAFISISFPRYSLSTLKATQFAHESGANIIAITDSERSPLAQFSHQLLIARSDMVSFADSLVAPLSLINALIVALGLKNKDKISSTLEKLENLWQENEVYKTDE